MTYQELKSHFYDVNPCVRLLVRREVQRQNISSKYDQLVELKGNMSRLQSDLMALTHPDYFWRSGVSPQRGMQDSYICCLDPVRTENCWRNQWKIIFKGLNT